MRLTVAASSGMRTPPGVRAPLVALGRRLPPAGLRVQVVLANDARLRRLNRGFRGHDRATDVLSFLYDAAALGPAGSHLEAEPQAEIYVSLPRAGRQARARRHTLRCEVALLVLHGLLHLQGHDHERPRQARRMRAAEMPHLRWLTRRHGWGPRAPLVPAWE